MWTSPQIYFILILFVQSTVRTIIDVKKSFFSAHCVEQAFCSALYELAAHPEVVESLREEVESIVKEFGWTKEGISKMWKLDSCLKEVLRYSGSGGCSCISLSKQPKLTYI